MTLGGSQPGAQGETSGTRGGSCCILHRPVPAPSSEQPSPLGAQSSFLLVPPGSHHKGCSTARPFPGSGSSHSGGQSLEDKVLCPLSLSSVLSVGTRCTHKRTDNLTQVSIARWKITRSEPNSLENPLLNPSRGKQREMEC